ncbi:MAG: GNAT family N-acetyltransferase [Candidatus Gastranaerophilales bacterium]|nr:GNAT family N-acetyltransferase [Candidatus Gastranaerophilales bacterium]
MLKFYKVEDIEELAKLAYDIWHEYWTIILSPEQIDYMVEKFQSKKAILKQIQEENYTYYFINFDDKNIGYIGVSDKKDYLFLSKLYISKDFRNKGIGSKAFEFIKTIAKEKNIRLTVNKYNQNTINAYNKWGFKTIDSVVTDIGSGFVMDDYIMEYET